MKYTNISRMDRKLGKFYLTYTKLFTKINIKVYSEINIKKSSL